MKRCIIVTDCASCPYVWKEESIGINELDRSTYSCRKFDIMVTDMVLRKVISSKCRLEKA